MTETRPQGLKPRNIKLANRRSVLRLLLEKEECAIGELAQALSLSRTSVVKALSGFIAQGLVEEAGKGASTLEGGKRPELFRLNADARFSISLRINKYDVVIEQRDLRSQLLGSTTFMLRQPDDYQAVLAEISEGIKSFLTDNAIDSQRLIGVVIGGDGQLDMHAGVILTPAHHSWGERLHICRDLKERTGLQVPFYLGSVVQFAGYQQMRKFPGERIALLLVAGVTGGCVAGPEMQDDSFTELVHTLVAPGRGEPCPVCGQKGCFHERVSTRRCVKAYAETCPKDHPLQKKIQAGSLCIEDVFVAADAGDEKACMLLDEIAKDFAVLVHNLNVTLRPHRIVLGEHYRASGEYMTAVLQRVVCEQTHTRFGQGIELSFGGGFEDFATGAAWFATLQYINDNEDF